jgi:hypothetical protein
LGGFKGFLQAKAALAQLDPLPLAAQFARQNQGGQARFDLGEVAKLVD